MATSPEDMVLGQLSLDEALSRLSVKHRAVLHLVFQQGFTAEEAAQILGVPVGTVKSRMSYARRALQRALDCWVPEDARHDA
jgi:RNA polymerase sigma-70 factor (ECF subfamily)